MRKAAPLKAKVKMQAKGWAELEMLISFWLSNLLLFSGSPLRGWAVSCFIPIKVKVVIKIIESVPVR